MSPRSKKKTLMLDDIDDKKLEFDDEDDNHRGGNHNSNAGNHHLNKLRNELRFKDHPKRPMHEDDKDDDIQTEMKEKKKRSRHHIDPLENVDEQSKNDNDASVKNSGDGNTDNAGESLIDTLKNSIQSVISGKTQNVVFNGVNWTHVSIDSSLEYVHNNNVDENAHNVQINSKSNKKRKSWFRVDQPPAAILDDKHLDDGSGHSINRDEIFVSLPSFRDSKRCGETLFSIYANATQPSKVHVGLVEQIHFDSNTTCIQEYCHFYQSDNKNNLYNLNRHHHHDPTKSQQCPYQNQISIIQLSTFQAKGSSYARALSQRKLLSNEQYCLSIDSHTQLIKSWDDVSKSQWRSINNEFAVLSNQPAIWHKYDEEEKKIEDEKRKKIEKEKERRKALRAKKKHNVDGDEGQSEKDQSTDKNKVEEDWTNHVYMNCFVKFNDYGIPYYHIHYDPKFAEFMKQHGKKDFMEKKKLAAMARKSKQTHETRRRLLDEKDQRDNLIRLKHQHLVQSRKDILLGHSKEKLLNNRIDRGSSSRVDEISQLVKTLDHNHMVDRNDARGESKAALQKFLKKRGRMEKHAWTGKGKFPKFHSINGVVEELTKPILSYSWSSSFSFSKCHLETSVPYDNFITQLYDTEDFMRYARMFTRGYDVYTPTTNIVYHDYKNILDSGYGKGMVYRRYSWPHDDSDKKESITRVHSILGMDIDGSNNDEQGKLGIYGLGKLRSLEQLEEFVGINIKKRTDNVDKPTCGKLGWVPYQIIDDKNHINLGTQSDLSLHRIRERFLMPASPMDNLHRYVDDLEPQPEFPKRRVSITTLSSYYNGSRYQHNSTAHHSDFLHMIIFCVLVLVLLGMKKVMMSDFDADFSGWIVNNMKQMKNKKGKLKRAKKSM